MIRTFLSLIDALACGIVIIVVGSLLLIMGLAIYASAGPIVLTGAVALLASIVWLVVRNDPL